MPEGDLSGYRTVSAFRVTGCNGIVQVLRHLIGCRNDFPCTELAMQVTPQASIALAPGICTPLARQRGAARRASPTVHLQLFRVHL